MLLAVLLVLGGAPAVQPWSPVPDGPAVATAPAHDLVSVRPAAPRGPATTPVPWAIGPASPGAAPLLRPGHTERSGETLHAVSVPASRSTRAPPAFAS
ncbi:hypothetical protein [Amycolatopsis eburnea]|uniref:Uncharacterized protein n=1 Tax=Amycolatopsis eburnea TaxID=2267691 RepID=A0A3R9FGD1_9PSEU|nr:hypothetical protein [Amycolatopsis eburnea]RSD09380.1 hypothetical protein EIY87_40805 [Amycolatopsis eburnea]